MNLTEFSSDVWLTERHPGSLGKLLDHYVPRAACTSVQEDLEPLALEVVNQISSIVVQAA
jgi:hypothetical protein